MLRSKVALAAKGNGPAQRALFEIARAIERELAVQIAANDDVRAKTPMADLEAARRIAAALTKVARDDPTELPLATRSASNATR